VAAWLFSIAGAGTLALPPVSAQTPNQSTADFVKYAMKLREDALRTLEPRVFVPTESALLFTAKYPWKKGIVTTVFWIGEPAGQNNPVNNVSSSWDFHWQRNYGGYDNPNPSARRYFAPTGFVPHQNPFYCALPYNDMAFGQLKPEARVVIPWFRGAFKEKGKSVCQGRWLAIRNGEGKVCFAQWSDCGPFRTDHWQYVFGNERPKPNLNHDAGLDVSPAVRDYLSLASTDVTDWKFVDACEVRDGPWKTFGDNQDFILDEHRNQGQLANAAPPPPGPTVILK
jgi:hypothetical protein